MRRTLAALLLSTALLATACHREERAPGATSPSEDQALNDAAAMLDSNSMEVNAVDMNTTDKGDDQ